MASAFGHALSAIAIGKTRSKKESVLKFFFLCCFCAVIPDADVLTFQFGIPYNHFLGHRGFFHSFFFSAWLAIIIVLIFYRKVKLYERKGMLLLLFFFLCASSHAVLDMMTDGGRGVAIFAPFNNNRYFFPLRPIKVSPLSIGKFFSSYGWEVIKSEMIWIGIPCTLYMLFISRYKKFRKNN
jgi:inner membrane protein